MREAEGWQELEAVSLPRRLLDGLSVGDREGLRGPSVSLTPISAVSQLSMPLRSKTVTNLPTSVQSTASNMKNGSNH